MDTNYYIIYLIFKIIESQAELEFKIEVYPEVSMMDKLIFLN